MVHNRVQTGQATDTCRERGGQQSVVLYNILHYSAGIEACLA